MKLDRKQMDEWKVMVEMLDEFIIGRAIMQ
jgi:hypothetical protein